MKRSITNERESQPNWSAVVSSSTSRSASQIQPLIFSCALNIAIRCGWSATQPHSLEAMFILNLPI